MYKPGSPRFFNPKIANMRQGIKISAQFGIALPSSFVGIW